MGEGTVETKTGRTRKRLGSGAGQRNSEKTWDGKRSGMAETKESAAEAFWIKVFDGAFRFFGPADREAREGDGAPAAVACAGKGLAPQVCVNGTVSDLLQLNGFGEIANRQGQSQGVVRFEAMFLHFP